MKPNLPHCADAFPTAGTDADNADYINQSFKLSRLSRQGLDCLLKKNEAGARILLAVYCKAGNVFSDKT